MRTPLRPLSKEERAARLASMGLSEDLLPLTLSDLELKAAQTPPGEGPKEQKMPIVSPKAATIIAIIGTLLGIAAGAVVMWPLAPAWLPFSLSALGAIALFLAGKSVPALRVGGAILPHQAVPTVLGIATLTGTLAGTLQDGPLKAGLVLLVAILGGLAGKVAQQELKPEAAPVAPVPPVA